MRGVWCVCRERCTDKYQQVCGEWSGCTCVQCTFVDSILVNFSDHFLVHKRRPAWILHVQLLELGEKEGGEAIARGREGRRLIIQLCHTSRSVVL